MGIGKSDTMERMERKMKKQMVRNFFMKTMMLVVVIMLGVSVVWFSNNEGDIVYAAANDYYFVEPAENGVIITENMTAPKPTTEGKENYIFAGYYKEATCETPVTSSTIATVYKKFVPESVLNVKLQLKADATAESESTNMRIVSSVDSLNYKNVGFYVYYNGATEPIKIESTKVFERIVASAESGVDYNYSAKVVDVASKYLVTATLINIKNANFAKSFRIEPYWITMDGTMVCAAGRYVTIENGLDNKNINIPVKVGSGFNTEAAPTVTLTNGTVTAASVAHYDGKYAHLNIGLESNKNTLKSLNVITVSDGTKSGTAEYRNLDTKYTGENTSDTSWYDTNKNEFVIATSADLYGLASLVDNGTTFSGKTLYLISDIEVNKGRATVDGWSTTEEDGTPIENATSTPLAWTPIGECGTDGWFGSDDKVFEGNFDGQMHTISGLYLESEAKGLGLFAMQTKTGTISNLSLKNSYFHSTRVSDSDNYNGGAFLGSVVGFNDGTVSKVYSDAILVAQERGVGGIAGRLYYQHSVVKECWFDGDISLTTSRGYYAGGIAGYAFGYYAVHPFVFEDCLFTGNITVEKGAKSEWGIGVGGILGEAFGANAQIELTNCVSAGTITQTDAGKKAGSCGLALVVGNTSYANKLTLENVYAAKDSINVTEAQIMCHDHNEVANIEGECNLVSKNEMVGYGNRKVVEDLGVYTNYEKDSEKVWVITKSGLPELKAFSEEWLDLGWYDNRKTGEDYKIATAEEMYAFSLVSQSDSFAGATVKLVKDIKLNSGTASLWKTGQNLPDQVFTPIGKAKAFAGTFDGQMYTISGLYLNTSSQYAGLFGKLANGGTITNFSLVNSYFNSTFVDTKSNANSGSFLGSVVGASSGTVSKIYSDAIVTAADQQVGGIVGRMEYTSSVQECWFDGEIKLAGAKTYVGGIVGYGYLYDTESVTFDIADCLYTGKIETQANSNGAWGIGVGGILGQTYGNKKYTINIKNCIGAGTIQVGGTSGNGVASILGAVGNSYPTVNLTNVYGVNESLNTVAQIYWKQPTDAANAQITSNGAMYDEVDLQGKAGYRNTDLDFTANGAWAARDGEVPAPKIFVENPLNLAGVIKSDTSWYKASEVRQEIVDEADMYGFMKLMAEGNTFAGKEVYLMNDLDMNVVGEDTIAKWKNDGVIPDNTWIGTSTFAGTFDGQGHTISGVYLNTNQQAAGLFGKLANGGTITNFSLVNSYFESTFVDTKTNANNGTFFGSVVGTNSGTVSKVYSDAIVIASDQQVGGIVGRMLNTSSVQECWFDGEIKILGKKPYIGGIVGYGYGETIDGVTFNVSDCLYTGSMETQAVSDSAWGIGVGGILGQTFGNKVYTINITNCIAAGTIKVAGTKGNGVASILGTIGNERGTVNLTNVYGVNESFDTVPQIYWREPQYAANAQINGKGSMKARADFLGTAGYQNTLLDFEDTWVARKDNVPGLKAFTKVLGETVDITNVEQNNWYDANETVFGISSASALKSLATYTDATNKISFQDKKIYLLDDIEINKVEEGTLAAWKAGTGTLPASWQPIGVGAAFNGTFDGGMHTISGVYMKKTDNTNKSEWTGLGLFAATGYYSTVKNFSLVDSYFELKDLNGNNNNAGYIANLGSIAGYHHGYMNNVYSNATIVSNRRMVGGIMGYSQSRGVTNVWYDGDMTLLSNHGREAGGIIGVMNSANTFENILFTGKITFDANVDYAGIGGLFGITETSSTVSPLFKNVVIAGELAKSQYANDLAKGSVVGLLFKSTVRVENLYVTNETWGTTHNTYGSNVGKIDGSITTVEEADLYGTFGYQNTNLDFENVWAARKNDVPGIKAFVDESISVGGVIKPDTSWYDAEAPELQIQDEADMYGFMQLMLNGERFANKTVTLTADIEMNAVDDNSVKNWQEETKVPANKWIASNSKKYAIFEGTFDGGNHTISGLYCVDNGTRTGLFGQVSTEGSVKNVRITDSYFNHANTSGYVGSVAAELYGPMENVYSDAVVDSKAPYTGGLVAVMSGPKYSLGETVVEDEVEYALYSRHTRIVKNCWFDGEVNAEITTADSRVGGFVAVVAQGKINFENSLFTGNISVKDVLDSTRIGGFVGSRTDQSVKDSTNKYIYIYVDESTGEQTPAYTTVNVNSCIAAGEIVVTGSTEARVGAVTGYATHGKFADTFATKGTYPVPHKNSNTYEGDVIQTHNTDRLIGYCVDEKYGSKLDYENDWSMRVSGVPIPKVFENIVGADKIENNPAALSEEIGLDTWGGTLANAVDYGVGNYVVSYSSDLSKYTAYLTMLKNSLGFTEYTNNSESDMDEDGVYNAVYTKAAGDWVLDITFVQREGKIYISISTIGESGLSPNLKASDANIALANTVGNVSFSMLELTSEYGAGFVFELPNGHFIINDGGQKVDAPNLVAYLKEQADTDKIIIDAWILTHPHNDHSGVLYKFFEDASLREDIYVNGVYLSEPNLAVKTIDPTDNDAREVENIFRGLMVMTQEDGVSKPAVYRMHMGERYYFCGLTVDVIQAQEQIPTSKYEDYNDPDYLNTMSTNCVYTLKSSGKKILLGGDSTNKNMQYIMETYGKNYTEYNHDKKEYGGTSVTLSNINVFATYHHGKNTTADYSEVTGAEVLRDKLDGGYDRHIDATKEYADYLLYNTNNAEGFMFDTILFPYHQVYDMQKSDKVYTYYPGGVATELKLYVGDDGSHVFPWNIGDINQYFIDNAKSYYTYGYEDKVNGVLTTKETRHGTVQFIFNTDSIETIIHDTNIVPTE